jgi:hypothetical protein
MLTELSIRTREWDGVEVQISFTGVRSELWLCLCSLSLLNCAATNSMTSWLMQTMKTSTREDAVRFARTMQDQVVFAWRFGFVERAVG